MASFSWLTATSADWLTAADWSGGVVPNSIGADVRIAVAGSYTVSIAAGETIAADSVTLGSSGGSFTTDLAVAGTLALGGTLGLLSLASGVLKLTGSLKGGTLALAGGVFASTNGTLDGMHVLGTLAPSRFQPINVVDGLVVQSASGTAPGSIDLTGGTMAVLDSETLDQVTISLGSPYGTLKAPAGGTLTLGTAAVLNVAGGNLPDAGGALLANRGLVSISPDPQGFGLTIAPSLLNAGSLAIAAGVDPVTLGGGLTNSGVITIGAGASLRAGNAAAAFSNAGSITIGAGATLEVDQNLGLAALVGGGLGNSGTLVLGGTLALAGATMDIAAAGAFTNVVVSGSVAGGTVFGDGGTLALPAGTLDGVTVQGLLALSNSGSLAVGTTDVGGGTTVTVKDGLAAPNGASIDVRGDVLSFADSETLTNLAITIGQTVANATQLHLSASGLQGAAGTTLTLGAGSSVVAQGVAFIAVPSLVNAGSLAVAAGASLALGSSAFSNSGAVSIGAGGKLSVTSLANAGVIMLDPAGTLEVDASLTLPQLVAAVGSVTPAGGQLVLGGTLDLGGGTLTLAPGGIFANLALTGAVKNGTIVENGASLSVAGSAVTALPTLDGVVLVGSLDLGGATKGVAIRDGLTVRAAGGGLPGTINLSGGQLTILDAETLDNVAISLGAAGTASNFGTASLTDAGKGLALTLGANAVVTGTGNATIAAGSFTNRGTDVVGATQQQWTAATLANAGVVTLDFGTLTLAATATTAATNSGSIVASDTAALIITGVGLSSSGLLQATAGATLTVGGTLANLAAGTLTGGRLEADAGATLDLSQAGSLVVDAAALTLNGAGSSIATFSTATAAFQPIEATLGTITVGHSLSVLGARGFAAAGALTDAGVLQLGGGVLGGTTVTVASGGLLRGFGSVTAALVDGGTVEAQGGLLTLGPLSGAGGLRVDPGGTLELSGASAAPLAFSLTGGAALLDVPAGYSGTISNFAPGDTLLLKATNASSASVTATLLTVTLAAGGVLAYPLSSPQANVGATVSIDPAGNAEVMLTAPPAGACFLEGTRLLTTEGERAIETLRVGDRMVTRLGGASARVVWTGYSRVACNRHPRPWDVRPVRVQADAFGAGQPHRTLYLSPDHAVFVDGMLVPVRYLLNGATVAQVAAEEGRYWEVAYWHVELERHDVVLAAGLPAESYLDTGNRGAFAGGAAQALHPDFALKVWEAQGCAPLVTEGAGLLAVRAELLARAMRLGHAVSAEPELRLSAGGRVLHPEVTGRLARFALPAGTGKAVLRSRTWVPGEQLAASRDHRRLGVAVTALRLDGMPAPTGGDGWLVPEAGWCWTDGAAVLDCRGARVLEVETAGLARYWVADPAPALAAAG